MWIFVKDERGMLVTTQEVIMKASSMLKDAFVDKSFEAQYKAIMCFLKRHSYIYCLKMNETMRPPEETHQEATEFLAANHPLLSSPHHNRTRPLSGFHITTQEHLQIRARKPFISLSHPATQRGQPVPSPLLRPATGSLP
jgi:hypothetical protein